MMFNFGSQVFEGTTEEFEACVRILGARLVGAPCGVVTSAHQPVNEGEPSSLAPLPSRPSRPKSDGPKDAATRNREYRERQKAKRRAEVALVSTETKSETISVSDRDEKVSDRDAAVSVETSRLAKGGGGDFSFSSSENSQNSPFFSSLSASSLSSEIHLTGQDRETRDETRRDDASETRLSAPRDARRDETPAAPTSAPVRARGVALNEWNTWKQAWISDYERIVEAHLGTTWAFPGKEIHSFQAVMTKFCTGANANPANVPAWLKSILIPFIDEQATRELGFRSYTPGSLLARLNKGVPLVAAAEGKEYVSPDEERRRRFERAEKLQYRLEAEGAQPTPRQKAILDEFRLEVRPKMTDADYDNVIATCTRLKLPLPPGFEKRPSSAKEAS